MRRPFDVPDALPEQASLFGVGTRATSAAAQKDNSPRAESQISRILKLYAAAAPSARVFSVAVPEGISTGEAGGLTVDEVERLTGLPHQSASARVYDLVREGALVDTGTARLTRTGSRAKVWKLAPAAEVAR